MNEYLSTSKAARHFGVSNRTIYRWCDNHKVEFIVTPSGQRRIRISSVPETLRYTRTSEPPDHRISVCYCRVSTSKQRDDLARQINLMAQQYPGYGIIKDIGSGLNFKRKGLLSLLEQAEGRKLRKVVVASKDRLVRFGFELFQWFFEKHNVELVVQSSIDKSPEQELTEDVLAIF